MTRVAIITHKFDKFLRRSYLLGSILKEVEQAGIEVEVTHGHRSFVKADLAILHVDATVVDPEYTALARRYPRTINLGIRDIRKSLISGAALSRGKSWDGPVIVKTELNARGAPEFYHNEVAALRGKPAPHPRVTALRDYVLFDRAGDVPEQIWRDPQLVVEKFMPERDPRGFALRTWCFMGRRETCSCCISADPVVKGAAVIAREMVAVPDELRDGQKTPRLRLRQVRFRAARRPAGPVRCELHADGAGESERGTQSQREGARAGPIGDDRATMTAASARSRAG